MSEVNGISNVSQKNVNSVKTGRNTSGTGSADFSSFLGESKSLDTIFEEAAQKYNVSVDLLKAVGKAESNFDAKAVSRCGAQGIMQLMPATAASLGVTDSFNAEQNIMGGAKYISGLLKKYEGDTKLALAAYNAGSGNVAKYGGIPPFKETQNYVVKVTNYMKQGVNSDALDTKVPSTSDTVPDITTVTPPITSSLFTPDSEKGLLEQDFDAIYSYNDYLLFLDEYLKQEEDNKDQDDSNYYASKNISYNAPVLNLLNSIN